MLSEQTKGKIFIGEDIVFTESQTFSTVGSLKETGKRKEEEHFSHFPVTSFRLWSSESSSSHLLMVSDSLCLFLCPQVLFFIKKFLLIEFIGVTLVNKIILVSGVQFYHTSSVHRTVCSPLQVQCPSTTIYPPLLSPTSSHPPFPFGSHHTIVCVYDFLVLFYLVPSPFFTQPPNPPPL